MAQFDFRERKSLVHKLCSLDVQYLSDQRIGLTEFANDYARLLPLTICVVSGYCSYNEIDFNFSSDEVYRISHIGKQKRVVLEDQDGQLLSFPEDYPIKFHLNKNGVQVTSEPQKLSQLIYRPILTANVLLQPCTEQASDHIVTFRNGADEESSTTLGNLVYRDVYDERYLIANGMLYEEDDIAKDTIIIPIWMQIKVQVINGIDCVAQQQFQQLQNYFNIICDDKTNKNHPGNKEIMLFEGTVSDYASGYSHIVPSSYVQVKKNDHGKRQTYEDIDLSKAPCRPKKTQINPGKDMVSTPPRPVKQPSIKSSRAPPPVEPPPTEDNQKPQPKFAVIPDNRTQSDLRNRKQDRSVSHRENVTMYQPAAEPPTRKMYFTEKNGSLSVEGKPKPRERLAYEELCRSMSAKENNNAGKREQGKSREYEKLVRSVSADESESDYVKAQYGKQKMVFESPNRSVSIEEERSYVEPDRAFDKQTIVESQSHELTSNRVNTLDVHDLYVQSVQVHRQEPQDEEEPIYARYSQVDKQVKDMSLKEVCESLRLMKLSHHIEKFQENDIDGKLLMDLNKEMLVDLKLSGFEALKVIKFVNGWRLKDN